ncbi:hypothetical protein SBRCBS47491_004851 [Sporothrix bragantina]|uniref:RING-type E3 ubiquitin transferase n=1 Tax=Sporothrix bragantina TaxID=671064 RepID=A0ABP0BS19_9PEZI
MDVEMEAADSPLCVTSEPGEATESIFTSTTTATLTVLPPQIAPSSAPASVASSSSADRCVICLDTVADPCVAQPCGHRHFDFLCLLSWLLSRHPSCPLCKATVETVRYGDDLAKSFPVPRKEDKDETTAATGASESAPPSSSSASFRNVRPRRQRRLHATPSSSLSQESPAAALERRRRVYRLGLYARHIGANRHSRYYRELTPQLFAQDPDLVSRARAFLRRELQVFWEGEDRPVTDAAALGAPRGRRANNVEFLLEYIVAILQTIDLQDSAGQAEKLLQGFFRGRQDHTRQFLHELRSFLRSPYLTLASWDRHVQYGPPGPLFCGDEDEDNEDGQTGAMNEQRGVNYKRQSVMRGDYYRPSRRHGSRRRPHRENRGASASRANVEEASRRFDPT